MPMKPFVSKYNLDSKKQAQAIWDTQVKPMLDQGKPVGLIYAANDEQARKLHAHNATNSDVSNDIDGGGQAPIFAELAKMIQKNKVQDKVHILPVATSKHGGDNTLLNNQVGPDEINRDLANIAAYRKKGWEIAGMGKYDKNGKLNYAIGGRHSVGWFDPNFISINNGIQSPKKQGNPAHMSQGAYVQSQLEEMQKPVDQWKLSPLKSAAATKTASISPPVSAEPKMVQAPDSTSAKHEKWEKLHQQVETPKVNTTPPIVFKQKIAAEDCSLATIATQLQEGVILAHSPGKTQLDRLIQTPNKETSQAADLLALHCVKSAMGNMGTQAKIDMVPNIRANVTGHRQDAMKIQFNSQEEAQAFAKKLFHEQGIQSLTFPGKEKTAQNGAVYLTPQDLEKLSQNAKLTQQSGTGILAYQNKAKNFEINKSLTQSKLMSPPEDEPAFKMK